MLQTICTAVESRSKPVCFQPYLHMQLCHCPLKGCISTGRSICDHSLHLLLQTIPGKKAFPLFLPINNINLKDLPFPLFFSCGSTDIIRLKGVLRFFWFLWWGAGLRPTVPGLPGPPPSPTQDKPRKASLPKSCEQLCTAKAKL